MSIEYKKKIYEAYVSNEHALVGKSGNNLFDRCDLARIEQILGNAGLWNSKNIAIADLGCGHGKLLGILKQLGFNNTTGVEVSGEQVELAKDYGIGNIVKDDVKSYLGKVKGKFELIFLMNILEHFDKDEAFELLEMIYSSLADNGVLIIRAPNAEGIFGGRAFFGDYTHETFFTALSMRQVLKTVGFEVKEFLDEPPVIHGLKSGIRFMIWKVFAFLMRLALYAETGPADYILTQNFVTIAKKTENRKPNTQHHFFTAESADN